MKNNPVNLSVEKLFLENKKMMTRLDQIVARAPFDDANYYADWLGQFFYFVAHATRLLAASAARLPFNRDTLHIRFIDHCQEEKHHEKLILEDLKALGYNIEDIPELPITAQLYQSQYYLIDYHDPVALFGCILYLEGMSLHSGKQIYQTVRTHFGEPASSFVRVHTQDDITHIDKAKKALQPLTAKEAELVMWSMRQNAVIYETMMLELEKKHGTRAAQHSRAG